MDLYLRTGCVEGVVCEPDYEVVEQCFDMEQYYKAVRPQAVVCTVDERCGNFDEVECTLDETTIQEECKRCLRCDLEWLEEVGLAPVAEEVEVEEVIA